MIGTGQRPLAEVSPVAQRRNSPSWHQTTKAARSGDSSPFDHSPCNKSSSPRLFWQGRESGSPFAKGHENQTPYDPEAPFPPSKRPSLENLKRLSRVKNSNIPTRDNKQEYDPAHVTVPQRPLATGRPLHRHGRSEDGLEPTSREPGHIAPRPPSPSKDQASPSKSSLSKGTRFGPKASGFDPTREIWSDWDGGYRQGKSVTFDAAPPQVNEYEMTTPDPSSLASGSRDGSYESEDDDGDVSFDRDSVIDREDSFDASLEDIEKTPVVLPEDWRFMSPENASDELVHEQEDPFVADSPNREAQHSRVESLDSNGERRPLPPLPSPVRPAVSSQTSSPGRLSAAFELGSGGQRNLPSPLAPASFTKSDISELGHTSMSLDERLRLMILRDREPKDHDHDRSGRDDEAAQDALVNHAATLEENLTKPSETELAEKAAMNGVLAKETFSLPRISRDSILRDIRQSDSYSDDSFEHSSQPASSPACFSGYDPDIPIPSLELDNDDADDSVVIKEEDEGEDIYAIPEYYDYASHSSLKSAGGELSNDGSQYSRASEEHQPEGERTRSIDDNQATPVPEHPSHDQTRTSQPSFDEAAASSQEAGPISNAQDDSQKRPTTPENKDNSLSDEEPSTPDSVIRHPVEDDAEDHDSEEECVPAPVATVKAPGGLKTRPSLTPADLATMAANRRKVSGQPPPPHILAAQAANEAEGTGASGLANDPEDQVSALPVPPQPAQDLKRQSSLVKLDIPLSIQEESLGLGLTKEFDRVIEAQKRGYLMRQNTKVIIASSRNDGNDEDAEKIADGAAELRGTKSAGSSPRKVSQQTWTTEPWNGKVRRASIKAPHAIARKMPANTAVPPLPGQPSNVQEVGPRDETDEPQMPGFVDEGEERGRLFVKVVGIKYIDLPLPRGERSHFALTLDNGVHCVTTSWLELGKSAPIGQEFELIVQNDLEFQLTLQMKVDETKIRPQSTIVSSPRQKTSTFSRVFASPRKRKELELKQQLVSQQTTKDPNAEIWDRLRTTVAQDGSFARAYVSLSDHEHHAYGRPYTVDVACFNEWAVEDQPSSVKSKKSTASIGLQRKPPYKIGKLELQLLFVPKPQGAKDDDMPKSMNACLREMREAENAAARSWEGFLSQQGGDCPYWRRRYFKLQGTKLTAFHEATRQPRATINLSKAVKLIDDKSSLTQKETTTRGGGRRKSAFAEEEEGYMFVEEGFRIRFGNGEVIDFYADSAAEKDGWMKVLSETVGKGAGAGNGQIKAWTQLVLKRERSMKVKRDAPDRPRRSGIHPTQPPALPSKDDTGSPATPQIPNPQSPRPRHKHTFSQPEVRSAEARRQKTRSLVF